MNSSSSLEPKPAAARPSLGEECASVLLVRRYIAEKDKDRVAHVISDVSADPEAATLELLRQGLISGQNQAAVAEFIKRAVRRFG